MLGILPGGGGTQRLPKLVGLQAALPMMLAGQRIRPAKAKRMKLVDGVADPFALEHAAIQAAEGLAAGTLVPDRGPKGLVGKLTKFALENTPYGRDFVMKKAREGVHKQTNGNYPAPNTIIDVVEESMKNGGFCSPAGYAAEARGFAELGMTSESEALRSIFFGQTACKKNPYPKSKYVALALFIGGAHACLVLERDRAVLFARTRFSFLRLLGVLCVDECLLPGPRSRTSRSLAPG